MRGMLPRACTCDDCDCDDAGGTASLPASSVTGLSGRDGAGGSDGMGRVAACPMSTGVGSNGLLGREPIISGRITLGSGRSNGCGCGGGGGVAAMAVVGAEVSA